MCRFIFWGLIVLLSGQLLSSSAFAVNKNHVRVVLDISMSLKNKNIDRGWPTDPDKLLLLSSVLLYDLVAPNTGLGDSFKILPFDNTGLWKPCSGENPPIPTRNNDSLILDDKQTYSIRDRFVNKINSLNYDAPCTYFSPGLKAAALDLKIEQADKYDNKVIFLLTDGVPDNFAEKDKIERDIIPLLQQEGILLYVLAFGKEAYGNKSFFSPIDASGVGKTIIIADASELISSTANLFSSAFGYLVEQQRPTYPKQDIYLNKDDPFKAAVVVFANSNNTPPSLVISPPPGGLAVTTNIIDASSLNSSYSLQWVSKPDKGAYSVTHGLKPSEGNVLILRKVPIKLEIRPLPPKSSQILKTMASPHKTALNIRVKSKLAVDLSYSVAGFLRDTSSKECRARYAFCDDFKPPVSTNVVPEGRDYELEVEFPVNNSNPKKEYDGYIEATAAFQENLSGSLVNDKAHYIEVHPYFHILPFSDETTLSQSISRRDEPESHEFKLKRDSAFIPRPSSPPLYPVIIKLDSNEALKSVNNALRGVTLKIQEKGASTPIATFAFSDKTPATEANVKLTEAQLTNADYEIIFEYRGHNPKLFSPRKFDLTINFILNQSPYNSADLSRYTSSPYTIRGIEVEIPSPFAWIGLAILSALLLLVLLWYTRNRPALPDDLGYAITQADSSTSLSKQFKLLEEASPIKRWLGLVVDKPIYDPLGGHILAWVKPVKDPDKLYHVRMEKGVSLFVQNEREPMTTKNTLSTVEIYRPYRVKTGTGEYVLRLEYKDE